VRQRRRLAERERCMRRRCMTHESHLGGPAGRQAASTFIAGCRALHDVCMA
jgi:hypothetical protein